MTNSTPQIGPYHFKAEFSNHAVDYLTAEKLTRINEICKGEHIHGDLQRIRPVKNLIDQIFEIDSLTFELKQASEILSALVSAAHELPRESKNPEIPSDDYIALMENISHVIHTNIIASSAKVVEDLDSILEGVVPDK